MKKEKVDYDFLDEDMSEYFGEIYVFRGEFTPALCGGNGALSKYFDVNDDNVVSLKKEYINSDVLWITDFRIPKTTESLLRQMANYRKEGTRFYGLQIGKAENSWEKYFDHIYKVSFDVSKQF